MPSYPVHVSANTCIVGESSWCFQHTLLRLTDRAARMRTEMKDTRTRVLPCVVYFKQNVRQHRFVAD